MAGKSKRTTTKTQHADPPKTPSLTDIHLTQEFDVAALWMSIPRRQRQPETQEELAKQLGVHPDSISDWKKRDDFWEKVTGYRDSWVKEEISDVIAGLVKKAKQGTAPEVKLFLQFAGMFTETSRTELTGKDGRPIALGMVDLIREAAQAEQGDEGT